jgi:hypothetical protein
MKSTLLKPNSSSNGKKLFFIAMLMLGIIFFATVVAEPPKFKSCGKELTPDCVCPENEKYIGKRNIILIDATDDVVGSKFDDLKRILKEVSFSDVGFFKWLTSGKKIEKTSVYILSDKKPVDMQPIAAYCSFPPEFTWLLTDLSESKERQVKVAATNDIENALKKIRNEKNSTYSHIVEGLAVATSNSASWVAGSKLVIVSDLYENSSLCGQFETGRISNYDNVSKECKRWADILGENLKKSSVASVDKVSSVSVCQILSKKQSDELILFWRELFKSQLGYDIKLTCDPQQIQDRHDFLNKR